MIPKEKTGQIDIRLDGLHADLEKLHSLYEQHFSGVIKREPQKEHQAFKTKFSAVGTADLKTTSSKFRLQGLQQKYTQYNTLWLKVLKQIEEGTYHRDLFLLEKKLAMQKEAAKPEVSPAINSVAEKAKATQGSKMLESLYDKMAQMVADATKLPSKEKFVDSLQRQIAVQKAKNPDKKVEIKLSKDANGKVQVKLGYQEKSLK